MKGTGEASCSDVSNTGEVSWTIDEYTCKGRSQVLLLIVI